MTQSLALSRRDFLAQGAMLVAFALPSRIMAETEGFPASSNKTLSPDRVDGFLAIQSNGAIIVYSGKVDLGTGVETALAQMVAEELSVPVSRVSIVQGDTGLTPDQGVTSGSFSIQRGGVRIRQAAATARRALLDLASKQLKTPPENLKITNGIISAQKGGASLPYQTLIGKSALTLEIDPQAPLKSPKNYKISGQSLARLDIPAKVQGRFTYMPDVKVPGMAHGRVVRPPAMGAHLMSVDENSVRDIPGLIKIVREKDFLGIVAATEWAAIKAAAQLQCQWTEWTGLPDEAKLWDFVRGTKVTREDETSAVGDIVTPLATSPKRLAATYTFPIHTHGSIGPSCAIAQFQDGVLTCWSSTQGPHQLRRQLAAMFDLAPEAVRVIFVEGSGCYGRNGAEDAAADAALLAKAAGQPVRVQWMREDEHVWDPKGPPTLIDLRAGLDETGAIKAWQGDFFVPVGGVGTPVALIAASLSARPHETELSPGGVLNNSALPYRFPNIRTVAHRLEETPFRPSWIRSPGRMQNTFANESFIDEIAASIERDPLALRLAYLDPSDWRGKAVLDRLADLAHWEKRPSPKSGPRTDGMATGRGLAYIKYELARTYVGLVAEAEVDLKSGAIRIPKFTLVQDCGQIINPDGVRNQLEGNVVQTLSRVLIEELTFDRSTVTSRDWASYPILTFPDVPDVVMELIDRPEEAPWGVGEAAAAVVPAAIANAIFDAVGIRLRSVPFTPKKVLAALARMKENAS